MAAKDVSCFRGDGFGHCEYDKTCGAHRTGYDHFVPAQDEDEDKEGKGSQKALQDVIYPKLFEFACNCDVLFHI